MASRGPSKEDGDGGCGRGWCCCCGVVMLLTITESVGTGSFATEIDCSVASGLDKLC